MTARRQTRVPVQLEVEYRGTGSFLVAYSTNLSKGGLFLQSDTPLAVGSGLKLRLHVPEIAEPIALEAVVAWVREPGSPEGYPPGMGLEFGPLEARYGNVIDHIVATFQGLRLLVVAPPGHARTLVARYLRSIVSCEVLELAREDVYRPTPPQTDLTVVDLDALGDNDVEMVRATRSVLRAPVVALSALEATRQAARDAGAEDALTSPPPFAELQASVIRVLSRPHRVR
jgi:uncharacterized protein (TIGR02266 family)